VRSQTAIPVTVVHSTACHYCDDAAKALTLLAEQFDIAVRYVHLDTPEGQELVIEHRPPMTPLVLVDGDYFSSGRLPRRKLTKLLTANGAELAQAHPVAHRG